MARPATAAALARFTDWITSYGDAWESGDPEAAASLFAGGATLQPAPFGELLRGREQIRTYFAGQFARWKRVSFSAQVLGVGDTYAVAHWRVASEAVALDGVLVAALDEHALCISLRQWWHETFASPASAAVH
jgi:ketosteroid isomerase-like protein